MVLAELHKKQVTENAPPGMQSSHSPFLEPPAPSFITNCMPIGSL